MKGRLDRIAVQLMLENLDAAIDELTGLAQRNTAALMPRTRLLLVRRRLRDAACGDVEVEATPSPPPPGET